MPIYTYRTYPPEGSGVEPREFELEQSLNDNTLVTDPESGFPVKRVVQGGHVYVANTKASSSCCGGMCGCY